MQEHIALRKMAQDDEKRKEREREELLEKRAQAQQEKMRMEYDDEMAKKQAKDDAVRPANNYLIMNRLLY